MAKIGSLQTPFANAYKTSIDSKGAGVATSNGYNLSGGEKGTPGKMEEVTTVTANGVGDAGSPGIVGVANQR